MPEPTGPSEDFDYARRIATDPRLPAWAVEVVAKLLDGDMATLDTLEDLAGAAPWLFAKGRDWVQ